MTRLDDILEVLGYIPEDDAWDTDGRRTYVNHDEDATRPFLRVLKGALARKGWHPDETRLRTFRHFAGDIIEIEPGGDGASGHFLHHMKAEVVA